MFALRSTPRRSITLTDDPGASAPSAPALSVSRVSRSYPGCRALDEVSLTVGRGELVVVLGPSGSGKSTLLRIVAGFEVPDSGSVSVDGRLVAGPATWVEPEHRGIGLVPQGDTLFPHLSVLHNVAFGVPRDMERAEAMLDLVGLRDLARRRPGELSGGERQRVALARALAPAPSLVLLDEPFSALDAVLRDRLRTEVVDILRRSGATAVLVTHDQEEALTLADRVAVLRSGRLVQCAPPDELFWRPADLWTARFLGEVNVLPGRMNRCNGRSTVSTAFGEVAIDPDFATRPVRAVAVRPEALVIEPVTTDGPDVAATVTARDFRGRDAVYTVAHPGTGPVRVRTASLAAFAPGDTVRIRVHPEAFGIPAAATARPLSDDGADGGYAGDVRPGS